MWRKGAAWGVLLSAAVGALTTCVLPHDLGPPDIEFVLRDTLVKIAVGGELAPSVTVLANGDSLPGAPYRLETLDSSVVTVDDGGLALRGTSRDTASVRVVFVSPASVPSVPADTTFHVRVVPAAVTVTPIVDTLEEIRDSVRLTATARDVNGAALAEAASFTWTSSDEAVATVNASGWVTGLGEGPVRISAELDEVTGTADVAVIQIVDEVQVLPGLDTVVAVTWTKQFNADAYRDGRGNLPYAEFTWHSSDTSIAVVDSSGAATARREGSTEIIATAGDVADTARLVVYQIAKTVSVFPGTPVVAVNDSIWLDAVAKDSAGQEMPEREATWQSDNTDVATVDAGLVTTLATGTAMASASMDGATGSATVVVVVPASVQVIPADTSWHLVNDTVRLSAVVKDADGVVIDAVTLDWSSSDEAVATVDARGLVTTVAAGTATITAAVTSGPSGSASVTVEQAPVFALVMEPDGEAVSTTDDPAVLFSAEPQDANGDPVNAIVHWSSLNENIATIDEFGEVTARGCGQVTIKAEAAGKVAYALLTVQDPGLPPVATWTYDTLPGSANSIWGTSSSDVYAVGDGYFFHYDGHGWTAEDVGVGLGALWGTSSTDLWATDQLALWHYDGVQWREHMTFPPGVEIYDLWGTSPEDIWMAVKEWSSVQITPDSVDRQADSYVYHLEGENLSRHQTSSGVERANFIWGFSTTDVWVSEWFNWEITHFDGTGWWLAHLQSGGGPIWGAAPSDLWRSQTDTLYYPDGHVDLVLSRWAGHYVDGSWEYHDVSSGAPDAGDYGPSAVSGAAVNDVYVVWWDYAGPTGITVRRWDGSLGPETTLDLAFRPNYGAGAMWTAPDDGSVWILGGKPDVNAAIIARGER